jgi:hypothetical protein
MMIRSAFPSAECRQVCMAICDRLQLCSVILNLWGLRRLCDIFKVLPCLRRFVANCLKNLTFRGIGPVLSRAVGTLCRFVVTPSTAVAGGAYIGSCVVVFVRADTADLCPVASLPVVAELLTFGALIRSAWRKVFRCPSWLTENYHSMF